MNKTKALNDLYSSQNVIMTVKLSRIKSGVYMPRVEGMITAYKDFVRKLEGNTTFWSLARRFEAGY
jgi:hypothetical protein